MLFWCYLLNYDPNIETFSDPLSFPLGGGPGLYINEDLEGSFSLARAGQEDSALLSGPGNSHS